MTFKRSDGRALLHFKEKGLGLNVISGKRLPFIIQILCLQNITVWTDGCKKVKYAAEQHLSG